MKTTQGISFIDEVMEVDYSATKQCRVIRSKQKFFEANIAFVLRKANPLTTVLNRK